MKDSRPLAVLLVSQDRALLRCLGKFLGIFGFEVQSVADREQVSAALGAGAADFLILDAEPSLCDALETARAAWPHGRPEATYAFLLAPRLTAGELRAACEAGIDDVLAKPLVCGELLARLRAGARELELERRLQTQSGLDPLTKLPNRRAFQSLAAKTLTAAQPGAPVACALMELDFLQGVERCEGRPAADAALRAAADRLRGLCAETAGLSSWGDGRMAALLPGMSEAEAVAWAERLCAEYAAAGREAACQAALESPGRERDSRPASCQPNPRRTFTLSVGVAAVEGGEPSASDALLQAAAEALEAARASGRNCVVGAGALEAHRRDWAEFAAADKLFERTVARDVMTPFPAILPADVSQDLAAELLRRSRLSALPAVDGKGRLSGLFVRENGRGAGGDEEAADATVRRVPAGETPTYDEGTPLGTLREFFARDARAPVVVTRRGRPTGCIAPENLAALGCKLTESTFAPATPPLPEADYLVVPDLAPVAEA